MLLMQFLQNEPVHVLFQQKIKTTEAKKCLFQDSLKDNLGLVLEEFKLFFPYSLQCT